MDKRPVMMQWFTVQYEWIQCGREAGLPAYAEQLAVDTTTTITQVADLRFGGSEGSRTIFVAWI